jgi:hypothetical protein
MCGLGRGAKVKNPNDLDFTWSALRNHDRGLFHTETIDSKMKPAAAASLAASEL